MKPLQIKVKRFKPMGVWSWRCINAKGELCGGYCRTKRDALNDASTMFGIRWEQATDDMQTHELGKGLTLCCTRGYTLTNPKRITYSLGVVDSRCVDRGASKHFKTEERAKCAAPAFLAKWREEHDSKGKVQKWLAEFGDEYRVPVYITAHTLLLDQSWHNDICPSFTVADAGDRVRLWADHPSKSKREAKESARYCVSTYDTEGNHVSDVYEGDDVAEAVDAALKAAGVEQESEKQPSKPTAKQLRDVLRAVVDDYEDAGCDGCGTISAKVHARAFAIVKRFDA